ncbi:hypothetical protein FM106_10575 [Brachybacterium faecium]|uniref:Uncharacterized protein n=1 Tax=Brachybacterium faecium (strain ATCC 43885 / DSM 4810 / JCM 11609 / LMG 19847 / NBRC 14762 / NCIMB 9860 / 6-10) TaxID=446465 RepID=C7MC26_BRAFD|nr:hypothetical protein [Brachybacterium faecium]ACU85133.1 hypothetical protein Bfae_12900 [Brachybacterium faecium DSM 4810]SLM96009.1 hypothetical protein FM106_10575 [Brachybacterium faecium]HJG51441.1 hypothetical protein [Brachybacterium faecium]
MDSGFWFEAGALLPSIGVGLLFWFVMRAVMRADRHEREVQREAEREYRELHQGDEQNHSA